MKPTKKDNIVSKGIGMGYAYHYKQYKDNIKVSLIEKKDIDSELATYEITKNKAIDEVMKIIEFLKRKKDDKAKIFEAHLQIINDIAVAQEVKNKIENELFSSQSAVKKTYDAFIKMFAQVEDELIRERMEDLEDVKNRLLRISQGIAETNLSFLKKDSIVIAYDLYPSDTATIDRDNVQAILTEIGGITSHTAIIAKGYGIPAMLGIKNLFKNIKQNDYLIVDAIKGEIFINPSKDIITEYRFKKHEYQIKQEIINKYKDMRAVTIDGVKIDISLNIGSASKEELDFEPYVDGVGLFRTEFLFMESKKMPSEEHQFNIYKKALMTFGKKPVILRTLDIGGDKELSYLKMPKEDNPFLGNRAIRLCFDNLELFKTQLRAALRASVFGNLWLMFPMVASIDDIYLIKEIINDVKKELIKKKIQFNPSFKIGVMIEIPSLIMIADLVAEEVDFASIGTNDLCQYLQAVDRMNPLVSKYYQSYSPSMFRIMKIAIDEFKRRGKEISVCGELGGDVIASAILIGLGIRKLSMNSGAVAAIKQLVCKHSETDFKDIANYILGLKTENEIVKYVKTKIDKEG